MIDWLYAVLFTVLGFFAGEVPIVSEEPEPLHASTTATVVRVIDGDTIDVSVDGALERVRYIGVDTPEPYAGTAPECYADEATLRNRELVTAHVVTLVADTEDRDDYDRLLRYVYAGDTFVNEALVREGFATTLPIKPNTRFASEFHAWEQAAQNAGVGLWSACQ